MKTQKIHRFLTAFTAAAILLAASIIQGARAQDDAFGPGTGGGPQWRDSKGGGHGPVRGCHRGNLTKEERDILKAAHEKIKKDAGLQALRKEQHEQREAFRAKMRQALIQADPRVEAILDKLDKERPSPEQMEKFRSVMEKVKDDPAVQAAREKMKSASTPEEKKAAFEEMRAVMKTAVAKIDPELAEKMPLFPLRGHPMKGGKKGGPCRDGGPGTQEGQGLPEPI